MSPGGGRAFDVDDASTWLDVAPKRGWCKWRPWLWRGGKAMVLPMALVVLYAGSAGRMVLGLTLAEGLLWKVLEYAFVLLWTMIISYVLFTLLIDGVYALIRQIVVEVRGFMMR